MPRFFTFAGGAYLAAAAAIAVLTPLLASANAAPSEEQAAAGASVEFNKEDGDGTLYIDWLGPIVAGMANDLRAAFDKYGAISQRVVLFLDSLGGQVEEGDRVIACDENDLALFIGENAASAIGEPRSRATTSSPRMGADYPMPNLLNHLAASGCNRLGSHWDRCGVDYVEPIEGGRRRE